MAKDAQRELFTSNHAKDLVKPETSALDDFDWLHFDWKLAERKVYKLQKRIYEASKGGDIRKVRKLQKTLLRSWSNKMLSVRRVTQDNRGKRTPGVDGVDSLTPKKRYQLAKSLKLRGKADPTRRVYIPKPNGEQRPLGIPTMKDRALQALVKAALSPEWEAKFEPNSYGFRPGRSCHDAVRQIKNCIQHKAKFVLDADIAKCFDRINHEKLLQKIGAKGQLRRQIKAWLKSGVMDKGTFNKTEQGTPQGGVISPLLANIALHGMEYELKSYALDIPVKLKGQNNSTNSRKSGTNIIRYADDFVIMHHDKRFLEHCKSFISKWLNDIGLELKPTKTRMTHSLEHGLSEDGQAGFNFLGFHIQQHKTGKYRSSRNQHGKIKGFITLITPSKESRKEHQEKLRKVIKKHRNNPQQALIAEINPIIRGWANYYKHSDIKTTGMSSTQDQLLYLKLRRWAKRRCKNKTSRGYAKYWFDREYYKLDGDKSIRKEFACGDKANDPSQAFHSEVKCSSTNYVKVTGTASPYDGNIIYWSRRLGRHPEISIREALLLKRQKGRCNHCHLHFQDSDIREVDHIVPKSLGGKDKLENLQLLHGHCHDIKTLSDGSISNSQANSKAKSINKKKANVSTQGS